MLEGDMHEGGGRLVGIVTVYDFLESAARLSAEKPDAGGRNAA